MAKAKSAAVAKSENPKRKNAAAPAAPVLGSQVRDAGNSNKVRGKPKG